MSHINRRNTLALLAGGAAASACATTDTNDQTLKASSPSTAKFKHGVASGDPLTDSVVLWTRITTDTERETVRWQLSETNTFETILAQGGAEAAIEADHTVKVIPEGLQPGKTYYYRFIAGDETSMTGRTKTLPTGSLDKLGIALASCSNYAFGYFNAYDAIAKDEAIDIVLHTGDYIYEYGGPQGWGHETAITIGRPHDPPYEIVSLDDYRRRHAQYKSDRGSQAMHAAHAFVACWDDHESTNNPWKDGAQNHQPETEGDWETRRAASLQAYYEWMPIREPGPGLTRADFWRTYSFGDLATLITLETRHTARGKQIDYGDYIDTLQTQEDRDRFMAEVINDPNRKMISGGMEEELVSGLSASVQSDQSWQVIGNASPIARMLVPDVEAFGLDPTEAPAGQVPGAGANLLWKAKWNLPFYTDTWDGYPVAREAFYNTCKSVGANGLLVLTGDSHSFWANTLFDREGRSMGVEIGTAGISSPGDFVETGWSLETAEKLDRIFEQGLNEVRWTDNLHQGYVRIVLTPTKADVAYIAVDNLFTETYKTKVLRTENVVKGPDGLAFT